MSDRMGRLLTAYHVLCGHCGRMAELGAWCDADARRAAYGWLCPQCAALRDGGHHEHRRSPAQRR